MDETTDFPTAAGPAPDPAPGPGPGPAPDPQAGPRTDWDHVKDVRGLQRPADRMVAGVAAGLARHLNVDPLVLRVAFAVLAVFGGTGIVLYGVLWLLLPEDGRPQATIPLDERSRGVALLGLGVLTALALVGDSWGFYSFPWPLAIVAVVVWFFWNRSKRTEAHSPGPAPGPAPGPGPGPGPAPAPASAPAAATAPAQAYVPQPEWTAPAAVAPRPPLTRPVDPRRRGPVLFWFTLALTALSLGVLGTVDLAGVAVVDSAYPALALTVSGAMLVLGAFWGRAGGIIALALVAALATLGALVDESWERGDVTHAPTSASEVRDLYELRSGELTLDLTGVRDPERLAGRQVRIEVGAGRIEVLLPTGVGHDLDAAVGVGSIRLPDAREVGGLGVSSGTSSSPQDAPRLDVDTELGVGEVLVTRP